MAGDEIDPHADGRIGVVDGIEAGSAAQQVGAAAALQRVIALKSIDEVASGSADKAVGLWGAREKHWSLSCSGLCLRSRARDQFPASRTCAIQMHAAAGARGTSLGSACRTVVQPVRCAKRRQVHAKVQMGKAWAVA